MQKLAIVVALSILVGAGSGLGQTTGRNNIGVYFDAEGTVNASDDGVVGAKHVYLVLSGLTTPTVDGFECKITATGGMVIAYGSRTFPAALGAIDVGTGYGEVVADFTTPLKVVDGRALVMEFDIFVTDPDLPGELFLDPTGFASLPGAATFLHDHRFHAASNAAAAGLPVLVTNGRTGTGPTQVTALGIPGTRFR